MGATNGKHRHICMRRSMGPAAVGLGNMHQSGGCVDSTYARQQGRPVRSYATSIEQEGAVAL
jgi:hypothetical protein